MRAIITVAIRAAAITLVLSALYVGALATWHRSRDISAARVHAELHDLTQNYLAVQQYLALDPASPGFGIARNKLMASIAKTNQSAGSSLSHHINLSGFDALRNQAASLLQRQTGILASSRQIDSACKVVLDYNPAADLAVLNPVQQSDELAARAKAASSGIAAAIGKLDQPAPAIKEAAGNLEQALGQLSDDAAKNHNNVTGDEAIIDERFSDLRSKLWALELSPWQTASAKADLTSQAGLVHGYTDLLQR